MGKQLCPRCGDRHTSILAMLRCEEVTDQASDAHRSPLAGHIIRDPVTGAVIVGIPGRPPTLGAQQVSEPATNE